jgi:hypothetical protein
VFSPPASDLQRIHAKKKVCLFAKAINFSLLGALAFLLRSLIMSEIILFILKLIATKRDASIKCIDSVISSQKLSLGEKILFILTKTMRSAIKGAFV